MKQASDTAIKEGVFPMDKKEVRFISMLSLLFGFTEAFFYYVISSYFAQAVGPDQVGWFYLGIFGVVFIALLFLHRILHALGGSTKAFLFLILGAFVISSVLSLLSFGWLSLALVMLLLVMSNVAWVALDVILEECSEDGVTGRVRGLHLTIMNAGLLFAPFFSTRTLDSFQYSGIFFGTTLGYGLLFAVSLVLLRNGTHFSSAKMEVRKAWKKMLGEKNLFHIYSISFSLEFFYIIMLIYSPMYLRSLGMSWDTIGLLFTVMLLPFVLLQYPLGLLADKRYGEKEFLILSMGIALLATIAIVFFSSPSAAFWAVLLFFSRIGAAGIEVLRDAYFYKQIDANDDDLIAFFRTARPAANIIGALLALPLLAFFPLQSVFILASIVLFFGLFSAFALEDTPSESEMARNV